MKHLNIKRLVLAPILTLLILINPNQVFAYQSGSTNYNLNEVQFGLGGLLSSSSSSYQSQEDAGNTGSGAASDNGDNGEYGFLTANIPFLQMTVSSSGINLGTLSSTTTATGTATFSVLAYVDSGYVVVNMSPPPTQEDGFSLKPITSAAASSVGTEQFGMNLVANTTSCSAPANFGANPVPIPSSTFATGSAATGYNTCGLFQFNQGDTIAGSTTSGWGQTNYTISYIANINPLSRAGSYSMTENLVAIATF